MNEYMEERLQENKLQMKGSYENTFCKFHTNGERI